MSRSKRISKYCTVTTVDGEERYAYEKFRWFIAWLEFDNTLPKEEQFPFRWAIIKYGLYEIEPADIQGPALDYFNEVIRPELDRQHKQLKEGKEI